MADGREPFIQIPLSRYVKLLMTAGEIADVTVTVMAGLQEVKAAVDKVLYPAEVEKDLA